MNTEGTIGLSNLIQITTDVPVYEGDTNFCPQDPTLLLKPQFTMIHIIQFCLFSFVL